MKKRITLTESELHGIIMEAVQNVLNEGMFDFMKKEPRQRVGGEEVVSSKPHPFDNPYRKYYLDNLKSKFKAAAYSEKRHNSDPLYINALMFAKEAYDERAILISDFDDIFDNYYMKPRTDFLNRNNWVMKRTGEKYPTRVNLEDIKI